MAEGLMLKAALAYAGWGWPVFPLAPGTKIPPKGTHGFKDATTDPDQVRKLWARHPGANIGLSCGDIVVIDLDVKKANGIEEWHVLTARHGISDDTIMSLTPSGGLHLLFAANGQKVPPSVEELGDGIDVRGLGSYIVLPPSRLRDGKEWAWDVGAHPAERKPADLPPALARLLQGGNGHRQIEAGNGIGEGQRNVTLTRLGGAMRRQGMTEEEIHTSLLVVNENRCKPPLKAADVGRIAKSVARYKPAALTLQQPPPMLAGDVSDGGQVEPRPEAPKGEAQVERDSWRWRSLAEAYLPKEQREYVIGGLFPIPSLDTVFGPPGALKTMLVQDSAVCVAGGKPWLGALPDGSDAQPFAVIPSPVLWVDVDNGLDRTERRFAALGKAHGVADSAPLLYISFPTPPFVASEAGSINLITDAVNEVGAKLVVFDNLGTISGGADENSSQMVAVMSGLRQIAEMGSCAVVVIHHKAKGDRHRAGDSLRGHSSIEGAFDLVLLVHREEGEDTLMVKSTKTRDIPVLPFAAMWTYEQDDKGELVKGRFFGLGRPESAGFTKQEQAELCILKDMEDGMNQTALTTLVKANAGVGRNTALAAIRRLVDRGKLRTKPGEAKGSIEYHRA